MAINKKYSYKDFMDKDLTALSASDFNNSEIVGSCFYQQKAPDTQVFPSGITGVKFIKCNLDNVLIPTGNTIEGDCHRKIKVQNDLEDWIVDGLGKPVEPVNPKTFTNLGLSITPNIIPTDFIRKEILSKVEWLRTKDLPEVTDWYLEPPQIISQETKNVVKIILKKMWDSLVDKNILTGMFDEPPSIKLKTTNESKEIVEVKGIITEYTIEGKGVVSIWGRKQRPMMNLSVTQAKKAANQQADIDAVKVLGGDIPERLGVK